MAAAGPAGSAHDPPAYETTCPRCGHDFDVGAEPVVSCPACSTRFRLADGPLGPAPSTHRANAPDKTGGKRRLTGREKAALANALLAPALCADAVNLVRLGYAEGGVEWALLAGGLPVAIAVASAVIAGVTGLRGALWAVPLATLALASLAGAGGNPVGAAAVLHLAPASLAAASLLFVACAACALLGLMGRSLRWFQAIGLGLALAVAALSVQAPWFAEAVGRVVP